MKSQRVNYFYCSKCGSVTKHIEIPFRELVSIKGSGIAYKVTAGILDCFGISQSCAKVMGIGNYKCCNCGLANQRNADGSINEAWNK